GRGWSGSLAWTDEKLLYNGGADRAFHHHEVIVRAGQNRSQDFAFRRGSHGNGNALRRAFQSFKLDTGLVADGDENALQRAVDSADGELAVAKGDLGRHGRRQRLIHRRLDRCGLWSRGWAHGRRSARHTASLLRSRCRLRRKAFRRRIREPGIIKMWLRVHPPVGPGTRGRRDGLRHWLLAFRHGGEQQQRYTYPEG